MSINPHALSAFPVRRYSRQVHLRITRLLWVHGYCSPLLCTYRSRSLKPMDHYINSSSCYPSEWTIEGKGLAPFLFHACTGVPSHYEHRTSTANTPRVPTRRPV